MTAANIQKLERVGTGVVLAAMLASIPLAGIMFFVA
jgi:hypothetical protein